MAITDRIMGLLRPTSAEKVLDIARVYHDVGSKWVGEGAELPTRDQYLAAQEETGVSVAVLQTIWQIETRQVALLNGQPLKRIEPGKWVKFGGDARDLPKPLNPGGNTPADTITGQAIRLKNFEALSDIDPIRTIAVTSHGGPQIMGFWAERCRYKDERAFYLAMGMGAGMQLVAMGRLILSPKNENMRAGMIAKDPDAIAFHWNGPAYKKYGYHLKVAAGLRKFA